MGYAQQWTLPADGNDLILYCDFSKACFHGLNPELRGRKWGTPTAIRSF